MHLFYPKTWNTHNQTGTTSRCLFNRKTASNFLPHSGMWAWSVCWCSSYYGQNSDRTDEIMCWSTKKSCYIKLESQRKCGEWGCNSTKQFGMCLSFRVSVVYFWQRQQKTDKSQNYPMSSLFFFWLKVGHNSYFNNRNSIENKEKYFPIFGEWFHRKKV